MVLAASFLQVWACDAHAAADRIAVAPDLPTAAQLEERHAHVGRVTVRVQNVFDTADPREDYWLYRTFNKLHYKTRESTVRAQLLFRTGDEFKSRLLAESERLLRTRIYLFDARVRVVAYDAESNTVEIVVATRDVWTLSPSLSFGRAGGVNGSSFGLQEENLLGTGTNLLFTRNRTVDRVTTQAQVNTETLFNTRFRTGLTYADNSDGSVRSFYIERPFYALDTRSAYGLSANSTIQTDSRYNLGQIVDQFSARLKYAQAYRGWSDGYVDGWTRRIYAGFRYDQATFAPAPLTTTPALVLPEDRRLQYPWLAYEVRQDAYEKARNQDQIGRTEDLYVGKLLYVEIGRASRALGSDRDAWLPKFNAAVGYDLPMRQQLFINATATGRIEDAQVQNGLATLNARYYARESERALFYAAATVTQSRRLDADSQVLLGGDTGLRGYPLRFQTGTGSALATVEQRFYSTWYPFRLLRVGGAVFADAGKTWGTGVMGGPTLGTLKDIGLGLRLGNSRSGFGNVLHVDVSRALDAPASVRRTEVTVQTQASY